MQKKQENDDRDVIRCNLIESYDRLMAFVEKHIDDKFYMENEIRVSARNKLFREVIANMLIHREYSNAYKHAQELGVPIINIADNIKNQEW